MREISIVRYRVMPSSGGKYIVLECEGQQNERFAFGIKPEVARRLATDLLDATIRVDLANEKED